MVIGRSEATASTGLVALPFELLTRIFEHLGSLELCRCACVAKAWTALALEPRFWRAICLDNLPLAGPDIVSVCRRYPELEALSLRNVALDVRTPGLVFRACPRISALCLAGVRAPCLDLIVHDMTGSLALLRELDLSGLSLTNAMLRVLEGRCARLERLNLSRCTLAPTESTVGGIRMLQLGHAKLRLLQLCGVRVPVTELNCPALESLDLSGEWLSDGVLLPMVASSPLLSALSLADCRNVTDAAVKDVLAHSRGLRSLNLSGCTCLTADALREAASAAPRLQTLVMARCPLLGDLATMPLTSARLTSLDLSGCDALRLADVSSPSLRALSLGGCRSLSRLAVDCAALDALVLDGCDGLLELELRTALRSVALPGSCSQLRAATLCARAARAAPRALPTVQTPPLPPADLHRGARHDAARRRAQAQRRGGSSLVCLLLQPRLPRAALPRAALARPEPLLLAHRRLRRGHRRLVPEIKTPQPRGVRATVGPDAPHDGAPQSHPRRLQGARGRRARVPGRALARAGGLLRARHGHARVRRGRPRPRHLPAAA